MAVRKKTVDLGAYRSSAHILFALADSTLGRQVHRMAIDLLTELG